MTTDKSRFLAERATALVENAIFFSRKIMEYNSLLRKKARFYNKQRLSKKEKGLIILKIRMTMFMHASQHSLILSQPIPKYPKGTENGGVAFINDNTKPESIERIKINFNTDNGKENTMEL